MDIFWRDIVSQRNSYACISAACEKAGYPLNLVDEPQGDVTLYSLNSINAPSYQEEISSAPCLTIVGGPHATAQYRELTDVADYVVVGEGEWTIPRLLASIRAGTPPPPGVATKDGFTPIDHSVLLDAYPSFSCFRGYTEISRGCPFSCAYCQTPRIFGHGMRHRSLDSIRELARAHKQIRFVTPNALAYGSDGRKPDLLKVDLLLSTVKKEIHHQIFFGTFPSEVRPEFVTRQALDLIIRYCDNTRLHIGAQSGSDAVLRRLHRSHTVEDARMAIDLCSESGLIPVIDLIVGFPDESDEEQMETVAFAREIARSGFVHAHRFIPLPGTALAGKSSVPLIPEASAVLGSLARKGKVTGSWNEPGIRFFRQIPNNNVC